jgi:hypothetical protein
LRAATAAPAAKSAQPAFEGPVGAAAHPPELPEWVEGGGTQWLAVLHTFGATQSPTEAHVVAHLPVLPTQIYGTQFVTPPSTSFFDVCPAHIKPAGWHWPPLPHTKPSTQSVFDSQLVLHAVESAHTRLLSHACAAPGMQSPSLSQVLSAFWFLEHVLPHAVFVVGYEQVATCVPSHCPPHIVPSPVQAGRMPCGVPVTAVHMPSEALTSQASHCPPHALSQQTPSTQTSLAHSLLLLHGSPSTVVP